MTQAKPTIYHIVRGSDGEKPLVSAFVGEETSREMLQQAVKEGFKSVVSLHNAECTTGKHTQVRELIGSLDEPGLQLIEPTVKFECALANALERGDFATFEADFDHKKFDSLLTATDKAPKPCLIVAEHAGNVALAVAIAYSATRHSTSLESAGDALNEPLMREYIAGYTAAKINRMMARQGIRKYTDEIWGGSQPSEDELKRWKAAGVKSVLNLRDPDEMGQVGLGVFPRQAELCKEIGLEYRNIAVPSMKDEVINAKKDEVQAALNDMPKPVVFHCITRRRIDKMAEALNLIKEGDEN